MSLENKRSREFPEASSSGEFRRYRQILTAVYLGTAAAGFALLTASVVKELFFRRPAVALPPPAISAEDPDPAKLIECQRRVMDLFTQLGTKTSELLALPPSGELGKLPASINDRWEEFSRAWRDEWDVANARCRFSELAETNLGVAYDRLAQVHADLQSTKHKYQNLIVRFDDEQAAELAEMRRALDQSRAAFEAQVPTERSPSAPGAPPVEPTPRPVSPSGSLH